MAHDPREILGEVNPEAVPAARPPEAANYRDAELQGIACAFCTKFVTTGWREEDDISIPVGYCGQWESLADGVMVCDSYADSTPPLNDLGNEIWDFADAERELSEIHFSATEQREENGYVIKEILRTGEWPVIPTRGGLMRKPLRIVRDGRCSKDDGVIAMEELVENFGRVIQNVQIPLSDDSDDHKNISRVNTGFVREIWIRDEGDVSKLVAKMEFTEPDVREKVLRGTYVDCSAGIPWNVASRGQKYGAALEHVAITNRPFIDGLGPFLALSDQTREVETTHFGEDQGVLIDSGRAFSMKEIIERADTKIHNELSLSNNYRVTDVTNEGVVVFNDIAETSWVVPFRLEDESVALAAVAEWRLIEVEGEEETPVEQKPTAPRQPSDVDDLEAAQRLRQVRLSGQPVTTTKEGHMPLSREELDALNLSDLPETQRAAFQKIIDENAALAASNRQGEADRRVTELEDGLGLKDRPGALKLYRDVMLSDDGGPAIVLLSDTGAEKERLTALQILDRFIDALKGPDGKVTFSDQALASGNDDKPPADARDEQKPITDRVADAKAALFGATA